jgi:hypothetical protein
VETHKLIWTKVELKEYVLAEIKTAEELGIMPLEVGPFAHINVLAQEEAHIFEKAKVSGVLDIVYFYFPPGLMGFVEVSVLLGNDLLAGPLIGDNQYYRLLISEKVKAGDIVKAVVRNFDRKFAHTPGIRLELMPDSV